MTLGREGNSTEEEDDAAGGLAGEAGRGGWKVSGIRERSIDSSTHSILSATTSPLKSKRKRD